MRDVTFFWLLGVVRSTGWRDRPHQANLDVLKTLYEREVAFLNVLLSAISVGWFTISAGLVGALVADLLGRSEIGSETRTENGVQQTITLFAPTSFDTADAALVSGLVVFGIAAAIAVLVNRALQGRLRRAYSNAIAIYFFLHRMNP